MAGRYFAASCQTTMYISCTDFLAELPVNNDALDQPGDLGGCLPVELAERVVVTLAVRSSNPARLSPAWSVAETGALLDGTVHKAFTGNGQAPINCPDRVARWTAVVSSTRDPWHLEQQTATARVPSCRPETLGDAICRCRSVSHVGHQGRFPRGWSLSRGT